ncbi:MAG: VapB-type antitoxin [Candidatus Micrarchaeaceae archaeon]
MESIVISFRITKDMKSKLEREGINVEKTVKEFLAQKASQIELKKTIDKLTHIVEKRVKPSKKGFAVKSIRADRDVAH